MGGLRTLFVCDSFTQKSVMGMISFIRMWLIQLMMVLSTFNGETLAHDEDLLTCAPSGLEPRTASRHVNCTNSLDSKSLIQYKY